MRSTALFLASFSLLLTASAQSTITLDSAMAALERNYPSLRAQGVYRQILDLQRRNAGIAWYPQVSINGQASYQSDVTRLPIEIPGQTIPVQAKDQYRIYADINQPLYDGGATSAQKAILESQVLIEEQKTFTELQKAKEQLTSAYFNALLAQEGLAINAEIAKDLQGRISTLEAGLRNGVVLRSTVNLLKVEQLKLEQKEIETRSGKSALIALINTLTGLNLTEEVLFVKPEISGAPAADFRYRPEMWVLDLQQSNLIFQDRAIKSRTQPKFNLFGQAGYGRPALNMLDNSFKPYYIGGIRMNWNISPLFTYKTEWKLNAMKSKLLDLQREGLVKTLTIQYNQQNQELKKLQQLKERDERIIQLHTDILSTMRKQLDAGTITATEYAGELAALEVARQNAALHDVQYLAALYQLRIISAEK